MQFKKKITNSGEHISLVYCLFPSKNQIDKLERWSSSCIKLWNLCLEQRLMNGNRLRGERKKCDFFTQCEQLTELRKQYEFFKNCPQSIQQELLKRHQDAWERYFKFPDAGKPRFKSYRNGFIGLKIPDSRTIELDVTRSLLWIPKLGWVRVRIDRPLLGKIATCSITKDVDRWYVSFTCAVSKTNPLPFVGPREVVGLDLGVINRAADSNENLLKATREIESSKKKLRKEKRTLARRKKGSKNYLETKEKIGKIYRKDRRKRKHEIQVESARLTKAPKTIVVEDLQIQNMIKLSKGMAKGISDASWGGLRDLIVEKLNKVGGEVVRVPPHYTSQDCNSCGHRDSKNRDKQEFKCLKCGHTDHADINAAKNIRSRYLEQLRKS